MLFTLFCMPRTDRDVRRHLLPRPGLHVRHPVRDQPRPPLRPVTALEGTSAMSNYHVEPIDKPAGPDQGGDQVAAQAAGPGHLAPPAACAARDRHRRSGCGCSRSPPARSASCGRTSRAASAAPIDDRRPRHGQAPELVAADRGGLPGLLLRRRAPSSSCSTPASSGSSPGEDTTGDGTALNVRALYQRCPHLGCKPNPCLKNFWFECPCHGSRYDRLGIKADGAAVRPGAAEHGPLLDHGRRDRRPDHQHRQDHARAAARRPRPARASSRRARRPGCI